ncbi:hypothetical protein L596_021342 [Steinernema carpocapsae]|uniref:Uncharacterized protein n=1 Tax=Steinernema carpocapsae TaxID=34508 RepID=A0A4U5MIU1_STECR|nr:hypothetical protein L596_021342 [Steinernema carpocapsae]
MVGGFRLFIGFIFVFSVVSVVPVVCVTIAIFLTYYGIIYNGVTGDMKVKGCAENGVLLPRRQFEFVNDVGACACRRLSNTSAKEIRFHGPSTTPGYETSSETSFSNFTTTEASLNRSTVSTGNKIIDNSSLPTATTIEPSQPVSFTATDPTTTEFGLASSEAIPGNETNGTIR